MTPKRMVAAVAALLMILAGQSAPAAATPSGAPIRADGMPPIPALTPEEVEKGREAAAAVRKRVAEGKRPPGDAPPPRPATGAAGKSKMINCGAGSGVCYFYLRGDQAPLTDNARGSSALITTSKPYVENALGCEHSLAQIAVMDSTHGDIVEFGWQVSPCRWPVGRPVLFASAWDDGTWLGYDAAAGWVDYAANPVNFGGALGSQVNHTYVIDSTSTHWWVGYQGAWVASLDKSVFSGGVEFALSSDQVDRVDWFWELASREEDPCSDMGHGIDSNPVVSSTAAFQSIALIGSTDTVNVGNVGRTHNFGSGSVADASDDVYAITENPANVLRGSGPGWNAAGTATGTQFAC